jgi:hypothetical protein
MATAALRSAQSFSPSFPVTEVKRRLIAELKKIADDNTVLRPEWEPLLDSKRVVGTILAIEDLFPGCKIPPDKVVRKGGYHTIDEAISDMIPRLRRVVDANSQRKVRK